MENLKEHKALKKFTKLVNNLEKALNKFISASEAYDAKNNKAA
ncbi:hypothetical protein SPONN_2479 [uncultured Candidatus Thioglobus sp.]|nr:hypothetical protein SPONN_2479 [uncultured Candidatus Thioglobus sp.]